MAITKKAEIARRYNQQLEAAKEAYKKERGLKVARGFLDSAEAKRIIRNKRQTLYRYQQKAENEAAKKVLTEVGQELAKSDADVNDTDFSGSAPGIGNFTAEIVVSNEIFFTALDAGKGLYQASFNMQATEMANQKTVGIIRFFDGGTRTYKTAFNFEKGIDRIIKDAEDLQQKEIEVNGKKVKNRTGGRKKGESETILYPMLSYVILEANEIEYHVVVGAFDEQDLINLAAEITLN